MLRISRAGFSLWEEPDQSFSEGTIPAPPPKLEVKREGEVVLLHLKNFLNCIRSRKTPNAPIDAGIASARAGHLGNLSLRQGRTIMAAA
jgi:hypothetical protein